jgi:hypothetical protein
LESATIQRKEINMSLDILRLSAAQSGRLAPIEPRFAPLFCLVLLTAACALASFAFACATPFAAFAVVAGAILPLPVALLVVAAAWIVNQAIGFGALGYPHEANTLLWGAAIGAAALISTVAAKLVLRSLPRTSTSPAVLALALVGAYAAYEVVLFAFTPALGGAGAFTLTVVARLGTLNLLWLIGLVTACEVFRLVSPIRRHQAVS